MFVLILYGYTCQNRFYAGFETGLLLAPEWGNTLNLI